MTEEQIRERIQQFSRFGHQGKLNVVENTSEFMNINADDVLALEGRYYLVRGDEKEARFGLEGEPKFWVKKGIDLSDGSSKIIKLVFHESVSMRIGDHRIECYRSPRKEGRVLEKVKADPDFMQGITLHDTERNAIRVIDRIQGSSFYDFIHSLKMDHETYFQNRFLELFRNVISSIEAIERLHKMGDVHGDIRTDHIFIDRETQRYRWIDFDFTYEWSENPLGVDLFGLGNVLLFVIGKGFYHLKDLAACGPEGEAILSSLRGEDMSLYSGNRIVNLKKLFSYIPECLNYVLLHFAQGAEVPYESTEELLEDLRTCESNVAFLSRS